MIGDHLGEGGFVTLPMTVRAGEDGHVAGRVHPNFAALVKTDAGSQLDGKLRGRQATGLDVAGEADTALEALPLPRQRACAAKPA